VAADGPDDRLVRSGQADALGRAAGVLAPDWLSIRPPS
jgi:hypothetical protein